MPAKENSEKETEEKSSTFAFISYAREDAKAASWLQKKLHWFRIPNMEIPEDRVPKHKNYIRRVYRDRTDLANDEKHYWENIQGAIDESRFLIVLCGRDSENSNGVNKEIRRFVGLPEPTGNEAQKDSVITEAQRERIKGVIPVILNGSIEATEVDEDPEESRCLPRCLEPFRKELVRRNLPDMRAHEGGKKKEAWEVGLVGVVSHMFGLKRSVVADHVAKEERRRLWRIRILAAILALLTATAVFFGWLSWERDKETRLVLANNYLRQASAEVSSGNWPNALGYLAQCARGALGSTDADTFLVNLLLQNNWAYKRDYQVLNDIDGEPIGDDSWFDGEFEKPARTMRRMVLQDRGWLSINESGDRLRWEPQNDAVLHVSDVPVLFEIGKINKESRFVDTETGQLIEFPAPYIDEDEDEKFSVLAISEKWLRAAPFANIRASKPFSEWKLLGPDQFIYAPITLMRDLDRIPHSAWFPETENSMVLLDSYKNGTSINAREHRSIEASLFTVTPTAALLDGALVQGPPEQEDWIISEGNRSGRRGEEDPVRSASGRFEARFDGEGITLSDTMRGKESQLLVRRNERMRCKFSPSGDFLLVLGEADAEVDNSELYLFDTENARLLWNPIPGVYDVSLSPDEKWIVTLHGPESLAESTTFEYLGEYKYEQQSRLMLRDIHSGGELVLSPIFYPAEHEFLRHSKVQYFNESQIFAIECPRFGEGTLRGPIPQRRGDGEKAAVDYLEWDFPICKKGDARLPVWFGEFAEAVACRKVNAETGILESAQPNETVWEKLREEALVMGEPWGSTAVKLMNWYNEFPAPQAILNAKKNSHPESLLYEMFPPWFWHWTGDDDVVAQVANAVRDFDEFNYTLARKVSLSGFLNDDGFEWPESAYELWEINDDQANSPKYWAERRKEKLIQVRDGLSAKGSDELVGALNQNLANAGWMDSVSPLVSDEVLTALLTRQDVSAEDFKKVADKLYLAPTIFGGMPENLNADNRDRFRLISKWAPNLQIEAMNRDPSLMRGDQLNRIGMELVKGRKYAEANRYFLRASGLDSKSVTSHVAAYSFALEKDNVRALAYLQKKDLSGEIKVDPQVCIYHGWAEFHLKRWERGQGIFMRLLKDIADTGSGEASSSGGDVNISTILRRIGEFSNRIDHNVGEAIGEAVVGYSLCSWQIGEKETAIDAYSFLIDPNKPRDERYPSVIPEYWKNETSFASLLWPDNEIRVLRKVFQASKESLGEQRYLEATERYYQSQFPSVIRAALPHYLLSDSEANFFYDSIFRETRE